MIINFEQKKQVIKLSQDVTNLRKLTNQLPENSVIEYMNDNTYTITLSNDNILYQAF